jgi:hypothetical protein
VVALLAGTLLALHGYVLRFPFISDDYVFLSDTWRGSWKNLYGAFNTVQNYFRPLGRELYFFGLSRIAGNHPLPFRLFNFAVLITIVLLVIRLALRFVGHRPALLAGAVYALLYTHRVEMAWVSCSQDLIATALALAATLAYLDRRAAWAGLAFFLALFAKESVVPLPLILGAWELWEALRHRPRRSIGAALRRTLPFWIATGGWAAVVFAVRIWRRAWAPGSSVPVADVTLRLGNVWEGFRSAILTYVYLDQPFVYLREAVGRIHVPWIAIVLLAATAWMVHRIPAASGVKDRGRSISELELGAVWGLLGTVPIALVGHHFSAYYVCFAAVGFALIAGQGLARLPLPALIGVLGLAATSNVVANGVESFRIRSNQDDLPGVSYVTIARLSYEAHFLDSLETAMRRDPPPRGAIVYLSHAPHRASFATAGERAPRVWFQDPELTLTYIGQYQPGATGRARRFLRFDQERRSFTSLPESLVDAIVQGEERMNRGEWPAARAALTRALALTRPGVHDIERVELANSLGVAANREGDTTAAARAWRGVLELDPRHRGALLNLAGLDASAGHYAAAKAWIERALQAWPDDPLALLFLARLERALGQDAAAASAWSRLQAADPAFADSVARAGASP